MFSIAGDATLSSINLSRVGGEDSDYTLVTLKLSVETRSDAAICQLLDAEFTLMRLELARLFARLDEVLRFVE